MRGPFGGGLVQPEMPRRHRRHEVEMLDDLAVNVERGHDVKELVRGDVGDPLAERIGVVAFLQDVLGAERVLPRAGARVGEVIEKGVAVHRELAQESAGGVEHAAHRGQQLAGLDLVGRRVGVELDRDARDGELRAREPTEQDRGIHELVVAVRDEHAVRTALERGADLPRRRIGQPEPNRRRLQAFGIADDGVRIEQHVIPLDRGAAHHVDRMVQRAVPGLADGVADGPHLGRVAQTPLVDRHLRHRNPPALPVECLEPLHEPADVHDLVRARRRGGELIDRVLRPQTAHLQRHMKEVVRAPVEIDPIPEGRRRWCGIAGGGRDDEGEQQRGKASLHGSFREWVGRERPGSEVSIRRPGVRGGFHSEASPIFSTIGRFGDLAHSTGRYGRANSEGSAGSLPGMPHHPSSAVFA